jgi:hypothetical protein
MRYDLRTLERGVRLVVHVTGRDEPLIDAPVQQIDRKTPIWSHDSGEVWTPLSLPLHVFIRLGAKNGLKVWSVKTRLLEVGLADYGIQVSLLLPTEEVLRIRVEQRGYRNRAAE